MSGELVTLTIDGKEISVPKGTLIIRAAEELGIEIPRFCEHPLLDPVAACRQCYVAIEGQRKLFTACSTPVGDGMAVQTQYTNDEVKQSQEAVLEYLLINHPLDCPICDRGGECPLQDQTLAFGPGESRYVEAKRTYRKPLHISELVYLDRERCVLCQRCTRFCDQISGDRFIVLLSRGAAQQVGIAPGEDFASPFSGNTIQVCPVGALTASTYRFSARPFDVKSIDTVCGHCAAGCNMRVDLRKGEVVRTLARDNDEVNDAWLCDKGRFAFSYLDAPDRLPTPFLRDGGLAPASFEEVFDAIADRSREGRVAFLAGGRLSDEDAYALSKLARVAFRTNDLDFRPAGRAHAPLEVEAAAATPGAPVTYRDVENAAAIVVAGLDAEQELPILHLRIRKAVKRSGTHVLVVHPRRTRLYDVAEHALVRPGEEGAALAALADLAGGEGPADAGDSVLGRAAAALREAGERGIVLAGPRLAESPGALERARALAAATGARFALLSRRAGDRSALQGGVHPALLPFGLPLADDAARALVEVRWGTLLEPEPGRDTAAILQAAAAREIDVLFLVGTDPLRDFPDAALARRALENVRHKVVVDTTAHEMEIYADAFLPAAASVEKDAHYTDWEGRAQRLRPVRGPLGMSRPDWQIFRELGQAMGADMGFETLDELRAEMGELIVAAASVPAPTPSAPASTAAAEAPLGEADPRALVLFTYPLLVDEGRQVRGADRLKQSLQEPAFVEINTSDAEALGLADGARARLATRAGEADLPVRVSANVARGAAFVPWNQPGFAANELLSGRTVAAVTVEPAAAEEAGA